jgi:hypothetical protein
VGHESGESVADDYKLRYPFMQPSLQLIIPSQGKGRFGAYYSRKCSPIVLPPVTKLQSMFGSHYSPVEFESSSWARDLSGMSDFNVFANQSILS